MKGLKYGINPNYTIKGNLLLYFLNQHYYKSNHNWYGRRGGVACVCIHYGIHIILYHKEQWTKLE